MIRIILLSERTVPLGNYVINCKLSEESAMRFNHMTVMYKRSVSAWTAGNYQELSA